MTVSEKMTIGDRIRQERKKKGLTQKSLAEKIGVSYQMVQSWENNRRKPKIETLNKLAQALDVDVYNLIGTRIETNDSTLCFIGENFQNNETEPYFEIPSASSMQQDLLNVFNELNWYGKNLLIQYALKLSTVDNCKAGIKPTLCIYPDEYKRKSITNGEKENSDKTHDHLPEK